MTYQTLEEIPLFTPFQTVNTVQGIRPRYVKMSQGSYMASAGEYGWYGWVTPPEEFAPWEPVSP